jgi:hypothetical protein
VSRTGAASAKAMKRALLARVFGMAASPGRRL